MILLVHDEGTMTRQSANDTQTLSENVISEVASREDVDRTELTPLHDVLDPDALDQLFHPTNSSMRMDGSVTFLYHGYEVTAYATGYITIGPQS